MSAQPPARRPVASADLAAVEAAVRAGRTVAPETILRLVDEVKHQRAIADRALSLTQRKRP